jgi:heptosyltransferase-2
MSIHPKYNDIQSVLIAGTSWLGDAVITIPTVCGIRSLFPQAHLSVLAKDTIADIFRAVPAVDEIISFHKGKGINKPAGLLQTVRTVKEKAFDLAIIFSRSFGSAIICFLARIPRRVGFNAGIRNMFLTEILQRNNDILSVHQVHYYKKLLAPFGRARFPELPRLVVPDADKKWAREFLLSKKKGSQAFTVGLNPGSTYGEAKQWLPERFEKLSEKLLSEIDCKIIIFGDSATVPLAEKINAGVNGRAVDVSGRTGILQLTALLECCDVLVTNDTGPMHVAGAVGTPVVAVFGSTDPRATAPLGPNAGIVRKSVPCSPCLKRKCPEGHYQCLHAVSVDDVEAAVLKQLKIKSALEKQMIISN